MFNASGKRIAALTRGGLQSYRSIAKEQPLSVTLRACQRMVGRHLVIDDIKWGE